VASPTPGSVSPARARAVAAIERASARFPDLLPIEIDEDGLDPRDAALAHAIGDGVARRWLTLEHLLSRGMRQPASRCEPLVRATLLCAAAQIVLLDRIPRHAAVHEAVEQAKPAGARAAGMVNAALRRLCELVPDDKARARRERYTGATDEIPLAAGGALALREACLPHDPMERMSIATSVPSNLLARWSECYGEVGARGLSLHALVHAPTIVNIGNGPPPEDASLWAAHEEPGFVVWTGPRSDLGSWVASHPHAWAQDPASARCVGLARELRPPTILDLCAGQGGKTRLLARAFPDARLIASDADTARLVHLRSAFRGRTGVEVRAPHELDALRGSVDLALLDVPCSNTGVLARRPEARYRWGRAQRRRLAEVQRSILERARELLAPSGSILYSTCSIEPEENERMVAWACDRLSMRVVRDALHLPRGLPGDPPARYTDASYAALLSPRA
jgi:16S rRNA (cytosine967-C5)-methyltransferase